ncbi:MAG: helix-turn-helix domain-containing protein [Solirubrobacteraceae bacterium]|nr:helix-turn-helix domain-containing protein [Solirubrobacteraceae bacterium]
MDHFSDRDPEELASRVGRLVRRQRATQGLSSAELAERSGLSRTIVAKIERGDGNPSLGTLWRLSRTLRVPIGELIGEEPEPLTRLIRSGEGERVDDPTGMIAELIHAGGRERRSEMFWIDLPAGTVAERGPHYPGVEEVLVLVEGQASAGPDAEVVALSPGDTLWFAADVPHRYVAGPRACRLLCWMLYPVTSP